MIKLEGYVRAALEDAAWSFHSPSCWTRVVVNGGCSCHVGKARFALSLYTEYGHLCAPNGEEFKKAIGCKPDQNWVLCRRTDRAVRQYGEDAIYLSEKQYHAGELKALQNRMGDMGVKVFTP